MNWDSGASLWGARRITAAYLVVGIGWILVSDLLVIRPAWGLGTILTAQVIKGSLFVVGSATLLYLLVSRQQHALQRTNEELEQSVRHVSVLHRVLRHNLRNSCDVIQNNVDLLSVNGADDGACKERIKRQTDQLTTIADKSRQLRDVVLDDVELVPLSVATLVDEATAAVSEDFPSATFDLTIDPELGVRAHPRFVVAIEELLRNAVVHGSCESPSVTVSARCDGDWTTIEIRDEGPGIPDPERDVLTGDREHPLNHSRGVGLWLVRFLVEQSDGEFTAVSDETGAVVRIRLRAAALPVAGR